jgi:hypothetical protein
MASGAQGGFNNPGNKMTKKGRPDISAISPRLARLANVLRMPMTYDVVAGNAS